MRPFVYWNTPGGRAVDGMPDSDGRAAIRSFGGYVQIGEHRVSHRTGRDEPWEVSFRGGIGTVRPAEWFEPIESFSRYADAVAEARRCERARAAKVRR